MSRLRTRPRTTTRPAPANASNTKDQSETGRADQKIPLADRILLRHRRLLTTGTSTATALGAIRNLAMDSSSQSRPPRRPTSPLFSPANRSSLAGPSRSRFTRSSAAAARPAVHDSPSSTTSTPNARKPYARPDVTPIKSPAPETPASGLLSSLSRAIGRPLSWLARPSPSAASTSAKSDIEHQTQLASHESQSSPVDVLRRPHQPSRQRPRSSLFPASSAIPLSPSPNESIHHHQLRSPSPALSSASAHIRARGARSRLSLAPSAVPPVSPPPSQSHHRRAGSLAPSEPATTTRGEFQFGYGSERRFGGLGAASTTSTSHLPSRSPLAGFSPRVSGLPSRSPLGPGYAASERNTTTAGTPHRSFATLASPAMSRAGSVGPSSSSLFRGSRSRTWGSGLNLAPPPRNRNSDGEDLLRQHSARTRLGTPRTSVAGTPPPQSRKRDATEALGFSGLDLDDRMSESGLSHTDSTAAGPSRKKQMVWDPEMGFISVQDLAIHRQPTLKPAPQNEAERILDALESMRTPLGDARKEAATVAAAARYSHNAPSRLMQNIPVPIPTHEKKAAEQHPSRANALKKKKTSGPYLKRGGESKEDQGMRSKLKRIQARERDRGGSRGVSVMDQPDEEMNSASEASSPSPTPPPPSPPRRVTRRMAKAREQGAQEVLSPPRASPKKRAKHIDQDTSATQNASSPKKSSAKQVRVEEPSPEEETAAKSVAQANPFGRPTKSAPAPLPPSIPAPEAGSSSKSRFQVLDPAASSNQRSRSTLRQGAEKTSRSHGKSGKISAWDSDDEEGGADDDLPDATELQKIKLPKGFEFPSGFSFGASAASQKEANDSAAMPPPPLPASVTQPSAKEGGDLLGRLGGFAPTPAPTSASAPEDSSKLSFSFKPPTAPAAAQEKKTPPATATSTFFALPVTPAAANNTSAAREEKNSGPPPNFFGKKAAEANGQATDDSKGGTAKAIASSGFSFSQPGEKNEKGGPSSGFSFSQPGEKNEKGAASGFSFSQPGEKNEKGAASGFSFGPPAEKKNGKDGAAGGFSFSQPVDQRPLPAASGFSFSGPSAPQAARSDAVPSSGFSSETKPHPAGFTFDSKPAEKDGAPSAGSLPDPTTRTDEKKQSSLGFSFAQPASQPPPIAADTSEKTEAAPNFSNSSRTPAEASGFSAPKSNGFNFSASTSNNAFGGFKGFGAANDVGDGSKKRSADEESDAQRGGDQEPAAKKTAASASSSIFGNPAPSFGANKVDTATSGFGFTKPAVEGSAIPAPSGASTSASASPAPEIFGASAQPESKKEGSANKPIGFSFGQPPAAGGLNFGKPAASTATASSTPVFGSQPSAESSSAGFTFTSAAPTTSTTSATTQPGATPSTPAQTTAGGNDMMDDSPQQSQQSTTTGFGGVFGGFGNSKHTSSGGGGGGGVSSSSSGFGFGSSQPAAASGGGFNFGPAAAKSSGPSTTGSLFGGISSSGFGSPAPSPVSSPSINFNFSAAGSAPQAQASTPFQFGASPATSSTSNGPGVGNTPFLFGGSGATPASPATNTTNTPFQFGSGTTTPQPQPQSQAFSFGAGGAPAANPFGGGGNTGGNAAAATGAAAPVMFNIGSSTSSGPGLGGTGSPGGRQVKGLPRSRRRG